MVDTLRKHGMPTHKACKMLEVSYGSYYNWVRRFKKTAKKRKH